MTCWTCKHNIVLLKLITDRKHRAASLRQQSYLFVLLVPLTGVRSYLLVTRTRLQPVTHAFLFSLTIVLYSEYRTCSRLLVVAVNWESMKLATK